MNLEQVIRWFEELAAAEFEAELAARSHADEQVVDATRLTIDRYFSGLTAQTNHRAPGSPPPQSEADVRQLFQPRTLIEASELESPDGALFTVATTSMFAGDRSFFAVHYIKEVPLHGLQVIARYHVCNDCHRAGKVRNRVCGECQGRGMCWRGGKKMPEDGKALRVIHLLADRPEA
ncbi:MAG: hypothetical protein U0359_15770 [Byssovorax sp.]